MRVSDIEIEVIKKNIKNIHLTVLPPLGKVRITAPRHVSNQVIRAFAEGKTDWIRKHIERIQGEAGHRASDYVTGEQHSLWGRWHTLEIRTGSRLRSAEIREDRILLTVREHASLEHREKAMNDLYRNELKAKGLPLVERWERTIGVKTNAVGIKNMRTRWGTCNTIDKRVWLNLQLARFPEHCLEYVVVHELVHLLVKNHGPVFKDYMDRYLPDWRERKREIRMGMVRS
jgi:hypothetical protein